MPFPRHCPNCGALVDEDATFCSKCGSTLDAAQSSTPEPRTPSSDSSYMSTRSQLSGELSQRLEAVLRRIELLSYLGIGLGVVILLESLYWFGLFG